MPYKDPEMKKKWKMENKDLEREYRKRHYEKHKEELKEKARIKTEQRKPIVDAQRKARIEQRKRDKQAKHRELIQSFGGKCMDCGITDIDKIKKYKFGLYCLDCLRIVSIRRCHNITAEKNRIYREEHKEEIKKIEEERAILRQIKRIERYERDRDKIIKQSKEYKEKNKEATIEANKRYNQRMKEEIRAKRKIKYKKNREEILARIREKNSKPEEKEKIKLRAKNWREKNPHKIKEIIAKNAERKREYKIKFIEMYGGECALCGDKRVSVLGVDHIKYNGHEHKKEIGQHNIYLDIITKPYMPQEYRVLCNNCNCALGIVKKNNSFKAGESKYMRSNPKTKQYLFNAYGSKCACCSESNFDKLTIDHINNDGAEHRKRVGGHYVYDDIIEQGCPKDKYRLLCFNCNMSMNVYGSVEGYPDFR
jgi:hypothetical protein